MDPSEWEQHNREHAAFIAESIRLDRVRRRRAEWSRYAAGMAANNAHSANAVALFADTLLALADKRFTKEDP